MVGRAEVSPETMRGLLDTLETFITAEGIAHPVDQGHLPMRRMIGQPDWDHRPSLATLASEVGRGDLALAVLFTFCLKIKIW